VANGRTTRRGGVCYGVWREVDSAAAPIGVLVAVKGFNGEVEVCLDFVLFNSFFNSSSCGGVLLWLCILVMFVLLFIVMMMVV